MRAVQLKSVFSSCFAAILLFASLFVFQGCGESNYTNTDADTKTETLNVLSSAGEAGSLVREHWNTDAEVLLDGLEVVYSPINGSGGTQKRTGNNESISVRLSLVEEGSGILAYGSIILDEEVSLTRHPLELIFKELPFEADEEGITIKLDSLTGETVTGETVTDKATLTTKTESGTLIQPKFIMTMNISQPIQGVYTCHSTIEIQSLNTIGDFNIAIERRGKEDPLAFVESTWGKKNRYFQISYPRKQYSEQNHVKALADRDILKLNISETEAKVLADSEFYLPAALAPNDSPLTIDLSDASILSNLLNNVVIEKTGMLDTVDLDGSVINTAYRLSLNVTKKFVLKAQEQTLCEESCKDKCTLDYSGEQRQTCQDRCENRTCVVKAEQYTLTASLEIDALNTRTTMVETLQRNDSVSPDEDDDGFHDNFYGAEFLLEKDSTYSATHAQSSGEISDVVQVSYDKVLLQMTVLDDGTKGLVEGQIRIPKEICPDRGPSTINPYTTISLGTTTVNLETRSLAADFRSLEIGTPEREGWVSTKIDKSYPTNEGELTIEEQGFLHLSVTTMANGAQECQVEYAGASPWTRITITGMEVTIKEPPTEANPMASFALVESPRQVVICKTMGGDTVNNLFESDVNVSLTLCKRWKAGVERIGVKEGRVSIGHAMDCTGAVSQDIPSDAVVDMGANGFTLVADLTAVFEQGEVLMDDALTVNLVKLSDGEFEFQVYLLAGDDRSNELSFYLPAQRLTGTGVFISNAAE